MSTIRKCNHITSHKGDGQWAVEGAVAGVVTREPGIDHELISRYWS